MIDSYSQLPISVYEEIGVVSSSDMDDSKKDVYILSLLSGKSCDEILWSDVSDVNDMLVEASFLLKPVGKVVMPKVLEIDGVEYEVSRNMTYGQYIDFEKADSVVGLLECVLIPKGHVYGDGYDTSGFGGISTDLAYAILDFFQCGLKDSVMHILSCSRRKVIFQPKKRKLMSLLMSSVENIHISLF